MDYSNKPANIEMTGKEIDVEILTIIHDNEKGDILCYIYSDSNLLDAVTLTEDLYEPAVTTLQSSPDQIIQIVAKDLLRSQPIGTLQFRLGLLLESSDFVTLPMNSTLLESIPDEITRPYIQLKWYSKDSASKKEEILERNEESEVFKAIQSELEVEKWKNRGLKQLREEMNASEMARVVAMQKLQSIVEEYEKELTLLKKQVGFNPYDQFMEHQKNIEEEYIEAITEWNDREKEYIESIAKLEEEKHKQDIDISKLRNEGMLVKLELDTCKNLLKVEKIKKEQSSQEEMLVKIRMLEDEIDERQRELDINKKITDEALEQLSHFQVHNTFLRSHIESIEEKMQGMLKEPPPDIGRLVNHHLEALSVPLKVSQVTENIFKIGSETVHLYFDRGELMAQHGGKTIPFVQWIQHIQDKNEANHKRSKSEDHKLVSRDNACNLEAKLDIVPEEEGEHEDEPKRKPTTPVKFTGYNKSVKKSPSGKISRNYSPILHKKKGK